MTKSLPLLVAVVAAAALPGCGAAGGGSRGQTGTDAASTPGISGMPAAHPQSVAPTSTGATTPLPVGDVNAHAPPLSLVRHELHLELVYAPVSSAGYINPLRYVTAWERTDQGVDAQLPVGAPILAPGPVKILAVIPDWYAGQPLVYFELLNGSDAGKVQYVAEQITEIARPGSILTQGSVIARFAKRGTGIEYGWSTPSGITLAVVTSGYEEGQITPAGRAMRAWLNSLGAGAGPNT